MLYRKRPGARLICRILPGESIAEVVEYIRETVEDDRVEVRLIEEKGWDPSPTSDTASWSFDQLQKSVHEVFPQAVVAPSLYPGRSDSRYFLPITRNAYRFVPMKLTRQDLERIHGTNERIEIGGYAKVVQFYTQLLINSSGGIDTIK
jgi:carboxypeptidase PM20D1